MTPEEFWQILHAVPETKPLIYRLYYDDQGCPICYSMEDRPGQWVEIDQAAFNRSWPHVRVRDGKIVDVSPNQTVTKLKPSASAGTPCHYQDVCVVVDIGSPHTKWTTQHEN